MSDYVHAETGNGVTLDVPRRISHYEVVEVIGSGGYAVVVSLIEVHSKEPFAAKVMKRPEANTSDMKALERELRLSMMMDCRYLVSCVDVVYMSDLIVMIMEHVEGSNLVQAISDNPSFVRCYWKFIFGQICVAVHYLHERGLAHRDIKLENIMVDKDYNVKVCDYGIMCETTSCIATTICGTPPYMSPELVRGKVYDAKKADIWALGICLYAIVTGIFPWTSSNINVVLKQILGGVTDVSMLQPDVRGVVLRCCDMNAETRVTIGELLSMPMFETVYFETGPSANRLPSLSLQLHRQNRGGFGMMKLTGLAPSALGGRRQSYIPVQHVRLHPKGLI